MNSLARLSARTRSGNTAGPKVVPVPPETAGSRADETEILSSLIARIYDASLDPSAWTATLGGISKFVPGFATALFSKDVRDITGAVYYDDGIFTHEQKQIYFDKYIKIDPFNSAHVFAEIGEPASVADWMSYEEYEKTRFYREWSKPLGLIDFVCTVLDKSSTGAALLGVFRHERDGLVHDEARRRMRLIVPHVRRAALIGKAIELKTAQAATLAETLDGIAAGMFLVNARGNITHVNAAGRDLLDRGEVLRESSGRLLSSDSKAGHALTEIFESAGNGDAAVGSKGIALPLAARDGEQYVAHVLPLTSSERQRAGKAYDAVAALFVRKAALESRGPLEAIAKTYTLTPAEMRVLLAVTEVGGVPEAADALGIAETTVRFHLRSLFAKTGTHRQADLVKLLASYSTLLAG